MPPDPHHRHPPPSDSRHRDPLSLDPCPRDSSPSDPCPRDPLLPDLHLHDPPSPDLDRATPSPPTKSRRRRGEPGHRNCSDPYSATVSSSWSRPGWNHTAASPPLPPTSATWLSLPPPGMAKSCRRRRCTPSPLLAREREIKKERKKERRVGSEGPRKK